MKRKSMTCGEAAKDTSTVLGRAVVESKRQHAERMKMTDAEREAYWQNAVKAR